MEKNIDLYKENNKLIAQFLGLTIITDGISLFDINYKPLAKYHESWNDLMPVVEKIVNLHLDIEVVRSSRVKFNSFRCRKLNSNEFNYKVRITTDFKEVEIKEDSNNECEATYKAVVSFIQWYNKINKNE